jgi:hypothetical protein
LPASENPKFLHGTAPLSPNIELWNEPRAPDANTVSVLFAIFVLPMFSSGV